MSTLVDDLADVRVGDKGAHLIVAVIPHDEASFQTLKQKLTAATVAAHFRTDDDVTRTLLPHLPALVFRLPGVLGEGVTGSTAHDGHGKTLGYHLLGLSLDG